MLNKEERESYQKMYDEINQILENLNKSDEQRKKEKEEAEKARLLEEERKRNQVIRNTSGINGGKYKEDDLYGIPFETIDDFKRRLENADYQELRNERSIIRRNNSRLALLKQDFKQYRKIAKKLKLWEFQRVGDACSRSFLYNIGLLLFVNIVTPFSVGFFDLYLIALGYSLLKEPIKEFKKVRKERSRCSEFLEDLSKKKKEYVDLKIKELEKEVHIKVMEAKLEEAEKEKNKINNPNIDLFDDLSTKINSLKSEEDKEFFKKILVDLLQAYVIACNNYENMLSRTSSVLMAASFSKISIDQAKNEMLLNIEEAVNKILDQEKKIDSTLNDVAKVLKNLDASHFNTNFHLEVDEEFKKDIKKKLLLQLKDFTTKFDHQNIRENVTQNIPMLDSQNTESSSIQDDRPKVKYMK